MTGSSIDSVSRNRVGTALWADRQPKLELIWYRQSVPSVPACCRSRYLVGTAGTDVGADRCRPAPKGADMSRPGPSGPQVARRGTPRAARLCRYQICNSWIFRSHLAKECPRNKGKISSQTTQVKGKPWCLYHKLNSHSSETCWALHPELRPSSSKERAAQSARQAKVDPA
jgi:hypothetical protein